MGSLTPIEELSQRITHRLPSAQLTVDAPEDTSAHWYVDVQFEGRAAVIEWRPRLGFGLSLNPAGYGEGPEIIFPTAIAASDYLAVQLARGNVATVLLASSDATWRGLLLEEFAHHRLVAEVAGEYSDAVRRLEVQTFDVVVVDVPIDSTGDEYSKLHDLLRRTSALVIAVGANRLDDDSDAWFEIFVRKVIAPSRIASIVESLAMTEPAAVVQ